jgi:HPt (histidine-containing phosphotransfer) domain-containing protein
VRQDVVHVRAEKVVPMATQPPIDRRSLLDRCMGDTEFAVQMLELFSQHAAGLIGQIRSAVSTGDLASVRKDAHAIKGSTANLSADTVRDAANRLEESCDTGDRAKAVLATTDLERELESCLAYVPVLTRELKAIRK